MAGLVCERHCGYSHSRLAIKPDAHYNSRLWQAESQAERGRPHLETEQALESNKGATLCRTSNLSKSDGCMLALSGTSVLDPACRLTTGSA